MRRKISCCLVGLLSLVWTSGTTNAQQDLPPEVVSYADMVLYNGKVLTVDKDFSVAQAVAVRDGRFMAAGDSDSILRMAGPNTKKVDLQGKEIVPGFVGIHMGIASMGTDGPGGPPGTVRVFCEPPRALQLSVFCTGPPSVAAFLAEIRKVVETKKPGEWVYIYTAPNKFVLDTRLKMLDQIAPNNPVYITPHMGDHCVVNSAALKLADPDISNQPGFERESDGTPSGHLRGWAAGIMRYETVPWPSIEAQAERGKERMAMANSLGYTTIGGRFSGYAITVARHLQERGELTTRVRATIEFRLNPHLEPMLKRFGNLMMLGDEWFRLTGGNVLSSDINEKYGTAYTLRPKLGHIANDGYGPFGASTWEMAARQTTTPIDEALRDKEWTKRSEYNNVLVANRYGYNINEIHSIGDAAFEIILRAFADADREKPIAGRRFGAVHGLMRNPDQLARAAKWDLQLAVTIGRLLISDDSLENLRIQYGPDWMQRMAPVKSLIDAGLTPSWESSDGGGTMFNRFQAAVTRKNLQTGQLFGAQEAVTREQALRMGTIWPARYHGSDKEFGSIEPGKLADFIIVDKDYMTVPAETIKDIPILVTVVDGKVVYDRDGWLGPRKVPKPVPLLGG